MNEITFSQLTKQDLIDLVKTAIQETDKIKELSNNKLNIIDDELIKINEVAKLFGVSTTTIFNWKRAKKLPSYRISNKVYYKKNEILNCLNKAG
jgi:predicted DNA-binding transcriptional regulator AlpA